MVTVVPVVSGEHDQCKDNKSKRRQETLKPTDTTEYGGIEIHLATGRDKLLLITPRKRELQRVPMAMAVMWLQTRRNG